MGSINFIFIVSTLVLIGFGFFVSSDVPTTINVNNTGPYNSQDIEDIVIYQGQNTTQLIDLDDYFEDDNGDTLIFNYSSLTNITLFIDSQNKVTFIIDEGYIGVQTLQFTASDGQNSVNGNVFNLIVGDDITPPQWSNPQIDRSVVYQSYYVTFTSLWTDNSNLGNYTLSINQGSGWTNQTFGNFSGRTNISRTVVQISASPGTTVYWQFYASDWKGNTNLSSMQNFTVQEFEITQDDFDDFYDSPGSSSGGARSTTTQEEESIETDTFTLTPRDIKITLRQGDTLTKIIRITNLINSPLDFTAEIRGVGSLAILSELKFTIPPKSTYDLAADFLIPRRQMPDQYYGSILVGSNERVVIPIILDVKPYDSALSLEVNLSEKTKFVKPGEKVKAEIKIKSLLDTREGQASLFYALKDFEGNILDSGNETFLFLNSYSQEKSLTVPIEAEDGEYIFYAIVFFDERVDLDSDTFFVGIRLRIFFILQSFLYLIILAFLIFLIVFLYLLYKRNKKKKKLLELYLLLNELRDLVKEGKTKNAIEVYRRIKVSYGQRLPKDYLKDEDKLKEELDKFAKVLKENPIESLEKKEETKIEKKIEEVRVEKTTEVERQEVKVEQKVNTEEGNMEKGPKENEEKKSIQENKGDLLKDEKK